MSNNMFHLEDLSANNERAADDGQSEVVLRRLPDFRNAAAAFSFDSIAEPTDRLVPFLHKAGQSATPDFMNPLKPASLMPAFPNSLEKPSLPLQRFPLKLLPTHFLKATSVYSEAPHESVLKALVETFESDCNVEYEPKLKDNQIIGEVYNGSGSEASFTVVAFQQPGSSQIVIEFKRTFGCAFLFTDFFHRTSQSSPFNSHVKAFGNQNQNQNQNQVQFSMPSLDLFMDDLDLPLPSLDLDLDAILTSSPEETVSMHLALLDSKYVEDQRDGLLGLTQVTRDGADLKKETLERIVDEVAEKLDSNDNEMSRHACQIVENVCRMEVPAILQQIAQHKVMLDRIVKVLDGSDAMHVLKCKRHLFTSLEFITRTVKQINPDLQKCLEAPKATFSESVNVIRQNLGPSVMVA